MLSLSKEFKFAYCSGEFSQIGSRLMELRMAGCHLYEVVFCIFFELASSDMNPQVGPIAFQGLGSLQVLDLSNNRLGRVMEVIIFLLDNIP